LGSLINALADEEEDGQEAREEAERNVMIVFISLCLRDIGISGYIVNVGSGLS
jgi:hypothetical protein